MASPTWWIWIWAVSRSWWRTVRPGVLQPMGSQRVGHNWVTDLNWLKFLSFLPMRIDFPSVTFFLMFHSLWHNSCGVMVLYIQWPSYQKKNEIIMKYSQDYENTIDNIYYVICSFLGSDWLSLWQISKGKIWFWRRMWSSWSFISFISIEYMALVICSS